MPRSKQDTELQLQPIAVRLPFGLLARLDQLQQQLQQRAAGVTLSRTAVIKHVLERGLDTLQTELQVEGAPPKRKPRSGASTPKAARVTELVAKGRIGQ